MRVSTRMLLAGAAALPLVIGAGVAAKADSCKPAARACGPKKAKCGPCGPKKAKCAPCGAKKAKCGPCAPKKGKCGARGS